MIASMFKKYIIPFCLLLPLGLFGQTFNYKFSVELDSLLFFDTSIYKYQRTSEYFSFIGEYRKAIETRDMQFPQAKAPVPTESDKSFFQSYQPVNAVSYILEQAAKTKIIIINEAHYQPMHRAFVVSLLKPLKELGYQCIGMEGLENSDSVSSEKSSLNYPTVKSGFYLNEPRYGDLFRTSIKEGYRVFSYEKKYDSESQKDMNRELAQAVNIKQFMDKHPNAKIIIYCGFDHIIEDSTKNFMVLPMAGQLKGITGIDPFTVDQVELSEYHIVGNVYRKLMNPDSDVVYVDTLGMSFNKSRSRHKKVDCMVYHPNTVNYNFRPKWLVTADKKLAPINNMITIEFPCLVKVYMDGENIETAVPVDIIELKHTGDTKHILLHKSGPNKVIVTNRKGQRQEIDIPVK